MSVHASRLFFLLVEAKQGASFKLFHYPFPRLAVGEQSRERNLLLYGRLMNTGDILLHLQYIPSQKEGIFFGQALIINTSKSMIGRHDYLVIVPLPVKGPNSRQPHISDWHSPEVQFVEGAQVGGGIDELLLVLGLEKGEVLLVGLVHVSLLIEHDIAQLFLTDDAFANGLADDIVDDLVEAVHLDVQDSCVVGVHFYGEDPHPSQGHLRLPQFDRLHDLLPLGQVREGVQAEDHDCGVQGLHVDQTVQVVGVDLRLNDVFEGLSTGLNEWDVDEVSESLLSQWWPRPLIDQIDRLRHLNLHLLLFHLLLHPHLLHPHLPSLLIRYVLEVAVEVVGIEVLLLVELHDIVIVEVHVFAALEIQLRQEELLVAFQLELGLVEVLAVDGGCLVLDEAVHAEQQYK